MSSFFFEPCGTGTPFLSRKALSWESDQESYRALLKLAEAEAAEAETEEYAAAALLLAMRELRRTEAMSLSRVDG
jgi:hypothetical protein